MKQSTTVLSNLLSSFDRSDFEKAVSKHNGDKGIRTLSTFDLFKTCLYGQITSAYSVREIEYSLSVNTSKLYHCGLHTVSRSTLCDALEKRNHGIFADTFHVLAASAKSLSAKMKKRFKIPIKIIDASTIDLCLDRFDWARFRKAKGAVKLHLKLDGDVHFPEQAIITNGSVHEVNMMTDLCNNPHEIYVMDRGYVDYKRLYDIELAEAYFVTRMKSNCQHTIVKKIFKAKTGAIRFDGLVRLISKKGIENYPIEFRKICYYDAEYERYYVFITNNFELTAQEIADIYKERWQVELFFKWIKQNLKIKTFWGTSKNAVFTQIWIALILALLLWMKKQIEGIKDSAQRILQALKTNILSRTTIADLLKPPPIKEQEIDYQLCFHGFAK